MPSCTPAARFATAAASQGCRAGVGHLRLQRSGCRRDKGATGLLALLPAKLAKRGYERGHGLCFTSFRRGGFNCDWEALRFTPNAVKDCSGGLRSRHQRVRISRSHCAPNPGATAAQSGVKSALGALDLDAGLVKCFPGSPVECGYRASMRSGGWTYGCAGEARAATPDGPFDLDRCELHAPAKAPLRARPGPHPVFGINDVWASYSRHQFNRLAALGADSARFTVNWAGVEPERPDLLSRHSYDWSRPQRVYDRMVARGIEPIVIIGSAPCWATGRPKCRDGDFGYPPSGVHLPDWAAFAAAVARRFPRASAIEVWNEANHGRFYRGAPRPGRYATLLEWAYGAIKGEDRSLPVLTSGLAPFARSGVGRQRFDEFLRALYLRHAKRYSDGIAMHTYPGGPKSHYKGAIRRQIADLKDVMLDFGDQDKPIWVTETGVSTAGRNAYTERQQARAVAALYRQFRRIPGVPAVIFHSWRDEALPAPGLAAEAGYGLQRENGTEKPVFCALAAVRGADPPGC